MLLDTPHLIAVVETLLVQVGVERQIIPILQSKATDEIRFVACSRVGYGRGVQTRD